MKLKFGEATWREAGETAGQVYQCLALEGPKFFTELVHAVNGKEPMVLIALGWLLREDKVEFGEDGRVSLKEHS